MKLYLSRQSVWTGTQADAKAAQGGLDYEHIEIPVDKPGLMAWLNANWSVNPPTPVAETVVTAAYHTNAIPPGGKPGQVLEWGSDEWRDEAQAEPIAKASKAPVQTAGSVSEQIMGLEGRQLFDALGAALGRLNEVAGDKGWGEFAKHTAGWNKGDYNAGPERALGMLLLKGLLGAAADV